VRSAHSGYSIDIAVFGICLAAYSIYRSAPFGVKSDLSIISMMNLHPIAYTRFGCTRLSVTILAKLAAGSSGMGAFRSPSLSKGFKEASV